MRKIYENRITFSVSTAVMRYWYFILLAKAKKNFDISIYNENGRTDVYFNLQISRLKIPEEKGSFLENISVDKILEYIRLDDNYMHLSTKDYMSGKQKIIIKANGVYIISLTDLNDTSREPVRLAIVVDDADEKAVDHIDISTNFSEYSASKNPGTKSGIDEAYSIYKEVNQKMESIDSIEADVTVNQSIKMMTETASTSIKSRVKQVNHTKTDIDVYMTLDNNIAGQIMKGEAWYRNGYYYYNLANQKFKVAMDLEEILKQAYTNNLQFDKSMVKSASIENSGEERTLTFTLDGKVAENAAGLMQNSLLSNIDIDVSTSDDMAYTMIIDKDNIIKSYSIQYTMRVTVMGQKASVESNIKFSTISVNNVSFDFPPELESYPDKSGSVNPNTPTATTKSNVLTLEQARGLISKYFDNTLDPDGDIISVTAVEEEVLSDNSVRFELRTQNKSAEWTHNANILMGMIIVDLSTGKAEIEYNAGNKETIDLLNIPEKAVKPVVTPDGLANFNGHYYKVFDDSMTWQDAKAYCESLGGHLATITSIEEQQFIENLLQNGNKYSYWLGATKNNSEGLFKWITSEAWTYENFYDVNPSWYHSDFSGAENYLILEKYYNASKWTGVTNDNAQRHDNRPSIDYTGFICEWDSNIKPNLSSGNGMPQAAINAKYRVVTEDKANLNIRKEPDISGKVLGVIPCDTIITVEEIKNNWGKVTYNSITGWASMDYMEKVND